MRIFGPEALFRDRRDAGRALAARLERYRGSDALVLGLPRGGADEVVCLHAPADLAMRRGRCLW